MSAQYHQKLGLAKTGGKEREGEERETKGENSVYFSTMMDLGTGEWLPINALPELTKEITEQTNSARHLINTPACSSYPYLEIGLSFVLDAFLAVTFAYRLQAILLACSEACISDPITVLYLSHEDWDVTGYQGLFYP